MCGRERRLKRCPIRHKQWKKGGCICTLPLGRGPRLRYQLDRDGDAFKQIYATCTAAERPLAPRLRACPFLGEQMQVSIARPSPSALSTHSFGTALPHLPCTKRSAGARVARLNTLIYTLIRQRRARLAPPALTRLLTTPAGLAALPPPGATPPRSA